MDLYCCIFLPDGNSCPNPATFWVGIDNRDGYLHCCQDHLEEARELFQPDDVTMFLLHDE